MVDFSRKRDWDEQAECLEADVDFFSDKPEDIEEALGLCYDCPVRKECLSWALQEEEHHGIWGGLTEIQLRKALSVNEFGKFVGKDAPSFVCPNCADRTRRRAYEDASHDRITCSKCRFTWLTVKKKRRSTRVDSKRK